MIYLKLAVERFKALGDMTRYKILRLVCAREVCVCEITEVLGVTSSCVSQHLRKLKAVGLVEERRDAQWVYYSANPDILRELAEQLGNLPALPMDNILGQEECERFRHLDSNPKIAQCKNRY